MTPSPAGPNTGCAPEPPSTWTERNQRWLAAAISGLRERLAARAGATEIAAGETPDCLAAGAEPGFAPALLRCAQLFRLSPFERELLLLAAGLELDHGLRTTVTAANGGSPHLSFAFALGYLTQPHWDALSPQAPLRYWRLVEPEPTGALVQAALKLDERILHFITGVPSGDQRLHGIARFVDPSIPLNSIDGELAQRIARTLANDAPYGPVIVLHAEPPDPAAQRDLALAAVAHAGQPALWISAQDLPADAAELATIARGIDREAGLAGAIPLLAVETANAEPAALGLVGRLHSTVLWLGAPSTALAALPQPRRVLRLEVPKPDAASSRAALLARWRRSMPLAAADDAAGLAIERAAAQFHLGPAAFDEIMLRLDGSAPAERSAAVWSAAREASRGGLDGLAQRIPSQIGFDDLVLPPAQLASLREIARQLRQRERVYRDWGFGEKHSRGQGLTALFAGESGTGKTLAAEAIANEVELDLYRIDLATVVSKYIGETEKNLKRLFDAAESGGAVLLFDEADALFGKRSEVKDSHDRYANIEVAYLLQRVEAYRGLAILTTNMRSALDRAFLRRIRFIVNFPFPDMAARERIWRLQFPPRAPLGAIDLTALARLNLAGGNIRNIALNAAFKAADAGSAIDQPALLAAARAEFAKLERGFNDPALIGSTAP